MRAVPGFPLARATVAVPIDDDRQLAERIDEFAEVRREDEFVLPDRLVATVQSPNLFIYDQALRVEKASVREKLEAAPGRSLSSPPPAVAR